MIVVQCHGTRGKTNINAWEIKGAEVDKYLADYRWDKCVVYTTLIISKDR